MPTNAPKPPKNAAKSNSVFSLMRLLPFFALFLSMLYTAKTATFHTINNRITPAFK